MTNWIPPLSEMWHRLKSAEVETGPGLDSRAVAGARGTGGKRDRRELKRRAVIAVVLVVLLGLAEVVFGFAIRSAWRTSLPLALGCTGILGFAIIDLWIRPRSDDQGARYVRRLIPLWALVPFLCALAASVWVHRQAREQGLRDIGHLVDEVAGELAQLPRGDDTPPPPPPAATDRGKAPAPPLTEAQLTTENIENTVLKLRKKWFPETSKDAAEVVKFYALARIVGHELKRAHGQIDTVRRRVREATLLDFCIVLGAQAVFVLWIPVLLMISMTRASHKLAMRAGAERGSSEARARVPLPVARSVRDSLDLRDKRILAENGGLFLPRHCFGMLLVLGTSYMFSPFGIKASCILSLLSARALPGQTSFALWSASFAEAPVVVVGFVGFLIYALITATQRFAQNDLDDHAVFGLLVRGLVVILLGFALSSSPLSEGISRLFVFMAGVFPLRALEAIAKRVNISMDPDFPSDGPGSFDGIPNLDPAKVFALRAAGIQSTYDLAAMPIEEIVGRVRIDPRLLGRAIDRAILIDAIGPRLAAELEPFAITSATELVAVQPEIPECVTAKLGDAPRRAADRLAADARVEKIRQWLAGAQS